VSLSAGEEVDYKQTVKPGADNKPRKTAIWVKPLKPQQQPQAQQLLVNQLSEMKEGSPSPSFSLDRRTLARSH